jgi:hypothetical protein
MNHHDRVHRKSTSHIHSPNHRRNYSAQTPRRYPCRLASPRNQVSVKHIRNHPLSRLHWDLPHRPPPPRPEVVVHCHSGLDSLIITAIIMGMQVHLSYLARTKVKGGGRHIRFMLLRLYRLGLYTPILLGKTGKNCDASSRRHR